LHDRFIGSDEAASAALKISIKEFQVNSTNQQAAIVTGASRGIGLELLHSSRVNA
jgi:hypothetical protein